MSSDILNAFAFKCFRLSRVFEVLSKFKETYAATGVSSHVKKPSLPHKELLLYLFSGVKVVLPIFMKMSLSLLLTLYLWKADQIDCLNAVGVSSV